MNAILAFRDLIPVMLLIITLVIAFETRNKTNRGSPLSFIVCMLLMWDIFFFGVLFYSTEGWHPILAMKYLLIGLCQGCDAVMH